MTHSRYRRRQRRLTLPAALLIAAGALVMGGQAAAANDPPDARPYDDKLVRLSVVLGAVHYLRELCGANDGQFWRDRMVELIETDKGSALRRVRLTKGFNFGYRSYKRTYQKCDNDARVTMNRFLNEGAQLSELLARDAP